MQDHVKKASTTMAHCWAKSLSPYCRFTEWDCYAQALDAAGLLRTGLEQRACDACEKYAAWVKNSCCVPEQFRVRDVGREIAESRKPRERWVAFLVGGAGKEIWAVRDTVANEHHSHGTEAQCRAVAEALNKLEAQ